MPGKESILGTSSSEMAAALTFRIAQPDDFDETVKLSNQINPNGHDYLELKFLEWVKMDNRAVLLAFLEGKLVGLQACFIVDDGKTFVRQAMRFTPNLQGKGFSRELSEAMDTYVLNTFPDVCRLRFTTYRQLAFSTPTRIVLEFDKLNYVVVKRVSNDLPKVPIVSCSKQYFCDMILSDACTQKLFPQNIILVDWCPFDAHRSNIDCILQEDDFLLVEKCDECVIPKSFSFGRLSPKVKLTDWVVTVYADDQDMFEGHIMHQFNRACEVIRGEFIFVAFQEKRFRSRGQNLLEEKLQLKPHEYFTYQSLYLYERDFGEEKQL